MKKKSLILKVAVAMLAFGGVGVFSNSVYAMEVESSGYGEKEMTARMSVCNDIIDMLRNDMEDIAKRALLAKVNSEKNSLEVEDVRGYYNKVYDIFLKCLEVGLSVTNRSDNILLDRRLGVADIVEKFVRENNINSFNIASLSSQSLYYRLQDRIVEALVHSNNLV